jgi:NADPH:quinone reductase-like Zn-dependent oxidoreductase
VLLADACGVVDAIGADVRAVSVGDLVVVNPGLSDRTCSFCISGEHSLCPKYRMLGEHVPGTAAEYIVLPSANVRSIPASTDVTQAAAFPLVTFTAWRMLRTRAQLRAGERVLIWGIGGGVALAALQICKQMGAEVWVASRDDAKLDRARKLGADHTLNSTRDDIPAMVRGATGKAGVDVVVDTVGHATWDRSLKCLGKHGRLVTCGATSGPVVELDVRRLFWNQLSILGSTMGNDADFDAVVTELRSGRLPIPVDSVFPIEQGRAAFERLASGKQFGKIVVTIP